MTDLTFKLDLPCRLFEPLTEEKLKQNLHRFERQMDGQVVAVQAEYSYTKGDLLRHRGLIFWLRDGNGILGFSYDGLPASKQAGLAEAVLRLDDDRLFTCHVKRSIFEMTTKRNSGPRQVVITADAIAVLKPGLAHEDTEWTAERLDRFCRFHCRQAKSRHEALARHDDLKHLIRLWHNFLQRYNLPLLSAPTVGDLLLQP